MQTQTLRLIATAALLAATGMAQAGTCPCTATKTGPR
jgi:hypothetical protein